VERGEYTILCRPAVSVVSNYTSLRQILQKLDGRARTGIMWFRIMEATVSCENGNELLGSTKIREIS
jgi:hypothetical protein